MPQQPPGQSIPAFQPNELDYTFVARLNQYARNRDMLSFFSVRRAQSQVLRPLCFQRMRVATSTPDAHEMYRVLYKYRDNIHQVTLVLDSETTDDLLFFGLNLQKLRLTNCACEEREINYALRFCPRLGSYAQ
ncbi:hypothetical protein H4R33_003647 [Dimargaris cristalligena]|nr:hypothetical protein H4R33_003647 [Dimargaris cristalligena]